MSGWWIACVNPDLVFGECRSTTCPSLLLCHSRYSYQVPQSSILDLNCVWCRIYCLKSSFVPLSFLWRSFIAFQSFIFCVTMPKHVVARTVVLFYIFTMYHCRQSTVSKTIFVSQTNETVLWPSVRRYLDLSQSCRWSKANFLSAKYKNFKNV